MPSEGLLVDYDTGAITVAPTQSSSAGTYALSIRALFKGSEIISSETSFTVCENGDTSCMGYRTAFCPNTAPQNIADSMSSSGSCTDVDHAIGDSATTIALKDCFTAHSNYNSCWYAIFELDNYPSEQ